MANRFNQGDRVSWDYQGRILDGNVVGFVPSGRDLYNYLPPENKGRGVRMHGLRYAASDRYLVLCKDSSGLRYRTPKVEQLDVVGRLVVGVSLKM
jgi:hypothetical protein